MNGKHIELFLIDGSPGGLTTAEIIGWTGHVMRGERSQLDDFLRREEGSRNGAYILLGDDEAAPSGVMAYIGRTERIGDRLRQHRAKKDFWDRFVVITTKDDTFTEGHWGYLEARLVELAKSADRAGLANDNYRAQHEQLKAEGGIRADGAVTRDVRFASPSTAGAVALGRSCNGRKEWIAADGQMYGSWEARGEAREA